MIILIRLLAKRKHGDTMTTIQQSPRNTGNIRRWATDIRGEDSGYEEDIHLWDFITVKCFTSGTHEGPHSKLPFSPQYRHMRYMTGTITLF
jgi:hypothetical protein